MTLQQMLAVCDFNDVVARAQILDALEEAGRLEERGLISRAGGSAGHHRTDARREQQPGRLGWQGWQDSR